MQFKTKSENRKAIERESFEFLRYDPGLNYGDANDLGIDGLCCIGHSIESPGFTLKFQ